MAPKGVAGTHGQQPPQRLDAGRPQGAVGPDILLKHQPEGDQKGLKAAGDQTAVPPVSGRFHVGMKGLWVPFPSKGKNLRLAERGTARRETAADRKVLEIAFAP